MANVFGDPIKMADLVHKEAVDKAGEAINKKEADSRYKNACKYVEELKKNCRAGVSTLCLIYNATGNTITYVSTKNWSGHIEARCPNVIQNGQWGAFSHVKDSGKPTGSMAGVVYRGKCGNDGKDCDYMMAWSNQPRTGNSVWTETRGVNYFDDGIWDDLSAKLDETQLDYCDIWEGCSSTIKTKKTDRNTSHVVEATFTLEAPVKA